MITNEPRSRRDFMKAAGMTGIYLAMPGCQLRDVASGGRRPNIVYLFSDEHRYQSMSFTEFPAVQTPNMARMARDGTAFRQAVSNNPLCVPHRCMLLSGQWSHRTGAVENQGGLAPWDRTLGHIFREAGYVTGYTGKWHAGGYPEEAGFDWHMNWDNTNNHWDSSWRALHGDGKRVPCDTYNATRMTDQALDFLDSQAGGGRPLFLMVAWNPPHAIFTDPPEEKKDLYPDAERLPWRENADEEGKAKWWENYQGYHAHITAIDEEIGRIREKLKQLGVLGDTLFIYTSDHGSMMNSHGLSNKRYPHEESCRVPFLITGPGIPAGQVCEELFGSIDIFPTLCGLAGIEPPGFCDGKDFSPNMRGLRAGVQDPETQLLMHACRNRGVASRPGEVPTRQEILAHHTPFFRGVRGKRYTYAVDGEGGWALWDNIEDPLQLHNRIRDPDLEPVRGELHRQLEGWLERAEDPFLNPVYHGLSLPERILQQARDGSTFLPLHHIVMRLKLAPEQFDQVREIGFRHFTRTGAPLKGVNRRSASLEAANEIRKLLTTAQLVQLEAMLNMDPHFA